MTRLAISVSKKNSHVIFGFEEDVGERLNILTSIYSCACFRINREY